MPQTIAIAMHAQRGGSWMLPEAKSESLLYLSADGASVHGKVLVLSYPAGQLVGTLTGFDSPLGECVDAKGDIFITDFAGGDILEYAHGRSTPITTLSDVGEEPYGCAVNPNTGDLAVTNYYPGNVAIYSGAKGSPNFYSDSSIGEYTFCAYDNQGNLFVDGQANDLIAELPKGSSSFTDITLSQTIVLPASMQWFKRDLVIVDTADAWRGTATVNRVHISGTSGEVVGTTNLESNGFEVGSTVQYWIQGHVIIGPDRSRHNTHDYLAFWRYPHGGESQRVFRDLAAGGLWGTAISN
jgi:hypothetical protein